ncbi:MAG: FAD:protein FMN transferase [Cellvibrionaceae bacterium]|nr:FAD:protein FMN transferase [Cellvibrionaceae bacterium]
MNKFSRWLVLSVLLLLNCAVNAEWLNEQQQAMGTQITLSVWHENAETARQAIAAVMQEMQRIDQTYSPYIASSELSRLNRLAATQPQPVSAEMQRLLKAAYRVSEQTAGAFDISFASVGYLYDYRAQQQPTRAQRQQKQAAIDYRLIHLVDQQVSFKHPDLRIDLGGLVKGYAVDRAMAILQTYGIAHASVSAGGDSRLLGDRRGRPWRVGIKHPRRERELAITLPLEDVAVSTSGDYERFFVDPDSGERIHHIINPRSGRSVEGVASVTVIGERGLQTDPLSTAVFVLGVDKGLALINQMAAVDVVIIDTQGKIFYSNGLLAPAKR